MANQFPAKRAVYFFRLTPRLVENLQANLMMSLGASVPIVKDYPVYNFKTEFKIAVNF
jgi:hypothetical protein